MSEGKGFEPPRLDGFRFEILERLGMRTQFDWRGASRARVKIPPLRDQSPEHRAAMIIPWAPRNLARRKCAPAQFITKVKSRVVPRLRGGQLPKHNPNIRIVPHTKLLDKTVRRIRGRVETTLTSIARFHRLGRAALRPGKEIDADDGVVRFRYRPFPTQKLGRWFGQPDERVGHVNK
jgi:hypothetical protein